MRIGCAAAYVLIVALGASCERQLGSSGPECTHPCDLLQTAYITVSGSEPAASIVVTGPCLGGVADCGPSGCRSASISLSNGFSGGVGEETCHVTASAADGRTVEVDLVARNYGSSCCAGYEFVPGAGATVDFSTVDAGTDAARDASVDGPAD